MLNPLQSIVMVILLFVGGCAEPPIDKRLEDYVHVFETHCKASVTLPIIFLDLPGRVMGRCIFNKEVQIDSGYWSVIDDVTKEVLILHELGHCTLYQGHRENSIMQNPLLSVVIYNKNREFYINELCFFNGSSGVDG